MALNISPHGAGLRCAEVKIEVGLEITVEIKTAKIKAYRDAIVRHVGDDRFGVEFTCQDRISVGEIQDIIAAVQRQRKIKGRIGSKG